MKDDVKVAKILVYVARELSALDDDQSVVADPIQVAKLAEKFLARLGSAKNHSVKAYGIVLNPASTVEQLARAWATVLLAQ